MAERFIGRTIGRLLEEHMRAVVPTNPVTVTPQQAKELSGRGSRSSA